MGPNVAARRASPPGVTSVSLSLPSIFNVTTPTVTGNGTLTAALANEPANTIFAGPTSGSGAPLFRALTAADLPNIDATHLPAFTGDVTTAAGSTVTTIVKIQGQSVLAASPLTGQVLRENGSAWAPAFISLADLRSTSSGNPPLFPSPACGSTQTLSWIAATDQFACIAISGFDASTITTGTFNISMLPTNVFVNGGNSFGTAATIGTNDANSLNLMTGGTARVTLDTAGHVGVGTKIPAVTMDVAGEVRPGNTSLACSPATEGALRYNSTTKGMEFCNGSGWAAVGAWNSTTGVNHAGISASLTSGGLAIALTTDTGAAPSAATPVQLNFSSGTGTTASASVSSPIGIIVPAGATLGQTAGVNQFIWVYALEDSGVVDICVSGVNVFFNSPLNSSSPISAAATSGTALYCSASHSGSKPTVILARLLVDETTAGSWASAPSRVDLLPSPQLTSVDWQQFASNITGVTTNPAKSASAVDAAYYKRVGDSLFVSWDYVQTSAGSPGSGQYLFNLPPGLTIDASKMRSNSANSTVVGSATASTAADTFSNSSMIGAVYAYSTSQLGIKVVAIASDSDIVTVWSSTIGTFGSPALHVTFTAGPIPVTGWSSYGP